MLKADRRQPPFMTYDETIDYLFGLQSVGIKLGLENIAALLERAGSPERSFLSVHVGGTNGKGSVSALVASMLRASGHRVGLFTSPHLVHFTERIRVDGCMISEADVVRLAGRFRSVAEDLGLGPTFFEMTTAIAFEYFREKGVAWAVVEVGLGGRLDSTNVIRPEVSVITNVGIDHEQYLGHTLREIAAEKAGIIKPGVPVVTGARGEALEVIRESARAAASPLHVLGEDFRAEKIMARMGRLEMDYRGLRKNIAGLVSSLTGPHQAGNVATALAACECLDETIVSLTPAALASGLRPDWPGRLEVISDHPLVIIDGAHNADAAGVLAESLRLFFPGAPITLVLGVMKDKRIEDILSPLVPLASSVILTAPAYGRAARPEDLLPVARRYSSGRLDVADGVASALALAFDRDGGRGVIVVSGSFYTTGEAKECLAGPGILSRLRE